MHDNLTKFASRLEQFWIPGDVLVCVDVVRKAGVPCHLCGDPSLALMHVLQNQTTRSTFLVGTGCLIRLVDVAVRVSDEFRIFYFPQHAAFTGWIEGQHPGCAEVLSDETALMLGLLEIEETIVSEPGDEFELIYDPRKSFEPEVPDANDERLAAETASPAEIRTKEEEEQDLRDEFDFSRDDFRCDGEPGPEQEAADELASFVEEMTRSYDEGWFYSDADPEELAALVL